MEQALPARRFNGLLGDIEQFATRQGLAVSRDVRVGLRGRKDIVIGLADDLFARYAEQCLGSAIEAHVAQFPYVLGEHDEWQYFDDGAEIPLALAHGIMRCGQILEGGCPGLVVFLQVQYLRNGRNIRLISVWSIRRTN